MRYVSFSFLVFFFSGERGMDERICLWLFWVLRLEGREDDVDLFGCSLVHMNIQQVSFMVWVS